MIFMHYRIWYLEYGCQHIFTFISYIRLLDVFITGENFFL